MYSPYTPTSAIAFHLQPHISFQDMSTTLPMSDERHWELLAAETQAQILISALYDSRTSKNNNKINEYYNFIRVHIYKSMSFLRGDNPIKPLAPYFGLEGKV